MIMVYEISTMFLVNELIASAVTSLTKMVDGLGDFIQPYLVIDFFPVSCMVYACCGWIGKSCDF